MRIPILRSPVANSIRSRNFHGVMVNHIPATIKTWADDLNHQNPVRLAQDAGAQCPPSIFPAATAPRRGRARPENPGRIRTSADPPPQRRSSSSVCRPRNPRSAPALTIWEPRRAEQHGRDAHGQVARQPARGGGELRGLRRRINLRHTSCRFRARWKEAIISFSKIKPRIQPNGHEENESVHSRQKRYVHRSVVFMETKCSYCGKEHADDARRVFS